MTTRAAAKAEEPQLPAIASNEVDFTAALRDAGFLSPASAGTDFNRVKLDGQSLIFEKEPIFTYDARKKEPLIVRLASEAVEYQALWFDDAMAADAARPNIANRMCRSHFDTPGEEQKFSQDGADCNACLFHPFMPKDQLPASAQGKRCSWKADIDFWIMERLEDGTYTQTNKTLYTLSMSTTGVIEYKGSASKKGKGPLAGSVSPENYKVQLAKLGLTKFGEGGILKAGTYSRAGLVIAELHILRATNDDGSRSWPVPSFVPIDILEQEDHPALPDTSGEDAGDGDIPF